MMSDFFLKFELNEKMKELYFGYYFGVGLLF